MKESKNGYDSAYVFGSGGNIAHDDRMCAAAARGPGSSSGVYHDLQCPAGGNGGVADIAAVYYPDLRTWKKIARTNRPWRYRQGLF